MAKQEYHQVRDAVDKLLNVSTVIKRKKKSETEKKREVFAQIMNSLEEVMIRSHIMYADHNMDLTSYEEKFMSIIDALIYLHFGQSCFDLISWYVYERVNPDGSVNHLLDEEGKEIIVSNAYELYDIIIKVNPNI